MGITKKHGSQNNENLFVSNKGITNTPQDTDSHPCTRLGCERQQAKAGTAAKAELEVILARVRKVVGNILSVVSNCCE